MYNTKNENRLDFLFLLRSSPILSLGTSDICLPMTSQEHTGIGAKSSIVSGGMNSLLLCNSRFFQGDIISMTVLGQTIVVINSLDTATELLGKRSSIYSDRPELPIVGWGNNTGNIRYGDNWRMQRRLTHAVLHKKASEDLWPGMVKQTRLALQRLLDNPDNFTEEFRR
ncbi:cytochrome P450 domain-containing protein [Rhizoctonia solani AG-1 IA]|uniref:Cytochrome P450 domain-containing protein n=1 Tax=Thanatephorus cucumeris (strain AG1-IA) TaxID=983506 RepID=L8WMS6_THACA|nr:cytochrome P450 domain-containing protein [Rhizoctonia solani AG-1 IA]